jgi:hypothetical protein
MVKRHRWILMIFSAVTVLLTNRNTISVSFAQEKYISAKDAANHVGEIKTVCGKVINIRMERYQPIFIYLDQQLPDNVFTIVVYRSDRGKFNQPPLYSYLGKRICVTGVIHTYRTKPEIILHDPSQITAVPSH